MTITEVGDLHQVPKYPAASDKEWFRAMSEHDVDVWIEHLHRTQVADHFPFIARAGALGSVDDARIAQWVDTTSQMSEDQLFDLIKSDDNSWPTASRLAGATFNQWVSRVQDLIRDAPISKLPSEGAVQYFSDGLVVAIIVGYRRTGSAVEITETLTIPRPTAFLDWVRALQSATTIAQQDLVRRALYSRHKIVIQRNVLVYVDREQAVDVFGPSIDTVLLNDWLFDNVYMQERNSQNDFLFEDTLTRPATELSREGGKRFLEIGCGNGLLTATWIRNQARIASYGAIDVSVSAIMNSYLNSTAQRRLHGSSIADRGIFSVSPYSLDRVQQQNDLVVCNPPYIPLPPDSEVSKLHPLSKATVGTDLLLHVLRDVDQLVAPGGMLALVMSRLAEPELRANISNGWSCDMVRSMAVPFQIEAIRGPQSSDHLAWLVEERGLRRLSVDGGYEHEIAIYIVARGNVDEVSTHD
jgi:methylase of polypeptide subunit release factors